MTVIVGTRCTDGIVIGTDSISTSGSGRNPLIQVRSDDKIRILGEGTIIVATGSIGLSQRFEQITRQAQSDGVFDWERDKCLAHLTHHVVAEFQHTGVQRDPVRGYDFGVMLAAPFGDEPELVEFNTFDLQPERKTARRHFVAMGSGQNLADPFLAFVSRVLWSDREPTVAAATVGVCWALEHAIKFAPGGIGEPIRLAVLRRDGRTWRARLLQDDELQEQRQHIAEIERRIGEHLFDEGCPAPLPTPPKPVGAG